MNEKQCFEKSKFFIVIFITTSLLVSAIGYFIWFKRSPLGAFITIIGPLIAAYLIVFLSKNEVKINLKSISFSGIIIGAIIPTLYIGISFLIMLLINNKLLNYTIKKEFLILLCVQWIFGGICEEIGWRGVLLPLLKNVLKYEYACLVNGVVWFMWHVPLICVGDMVYQFNLAQGLVLFLIEIISMTFIMGAISESKYGNSIWPFVSIHAVHNILMVIMMKYIGGVQLDLAGDGGYIINLVIFIFAVDMNYFIVYKKDVLK